MQNAKLLEALSGEPLIKYVTKRDGSHQDVSIEKIKQRMKCHSYGLNEDFINFDVVVNKVFSGIYAGKYLNFPVLFTDVPY